MPKPEKPVRDPTVYLRTEEGAKLRSLRAQVDKLEESLQKLAPGDAWHAADSFAARADKTYAGRLSYCTGGGRSSRSAPGIFRWVPDVGWTYTNGRPVDLFDDTRLEIWTDTPLSSADPSPK